jgi:hypothetical protein
MVRFVFGLISGLALTVGLMVMPTSAQEDDLRIVTIRDTNLYAEASWDAEVLTVIPAGTVLAYQHNVSPNGFMTMSYDGYDGWIPLDSFVSYADYDGTNEGTEQGSTDVEALPDTGAGPGVPVSLLLPVFGVALLSLIVAVHLRAKVR